MHEIKYNQPQFKSTFVNNKAYANICQYAKTQPDYKKFETVINELKKIGNHKIDISYGKVLEADETKPKPKKFTNELDYSCLKHNPLGWQEALYYKTMATFIKLKTGNDYMYISTFSKSFEPVELAYNAIMSLSNKTSNLFRFINNTPEECKKISAEEKELVNIIKTWNKENSNIFTKFKCLPHRYPNNDNKRLCDSMSILDYLQKIKESRLFDFDSKYMEKQAVLYDYNNLQQKLNQKQKSVSVNEIKEFLYKICSDDELRTKLAKEFSSEPRSGMKLKEILIDLLGGGQQGELLFNEWYFDEKSGYRKAYNDYYKHELYENATDLMTLVKQSPNIGTLAFKDKAKELGVELTLGELPSDIETKEDFKELLKHLKRLEKKHTNIKKQVELNINDKIYLAEKINSGHSAKTKYIVKQKSEDAKTYVLKFSPYNVAGTTDRSGKLNDSFMLRGDSPYLDALIDFYLKENKCKNASDIKYFDYQEKAVLYEMTKGKQLELSDMDFYNAYLLNNSERLKDVKDLGVLINDINYKNIIETKDGVLKIVDTGHAGFYSPFRPMVQGIHISLSNLCGRELLIY